MHSPDLNRRHFIPKNGYRYRLFCAAIHLACKYNVFQRQGNMGADGLLQRIG